MTILNNFKALGTTRPFNPAKPVAAEQAAVHKAPVARAATSAYSKDYLDLQGGAPTSCATSRLFWWMDDVAPIESISIPGGGKGAGEAPTEAAFSAEYAEARIRLANLKVTAK